MMRPGGHAKLTPVTRGRDKVSAEAEAAYLADVALAANFDELLATARDAEQDFRPAQAAGAPAAEQYPLAKRLSGALTDAMRSAYAARARRDRPARLRRTGSTGARPRPSPPCTR